MRILIVHNEYRQAAGEAAVVAAEYALLREHGNDVEQLIFDSSELNSPAAIVAAAANIAYSRSARDKISRVIAGFRPDIVHIHNTFPLITPSVLDACRANRVPVVKTLHNFRLVCAAATLFRNGSICEQCLNGTPYQSVLYGCYRRSRLATLPVAHLISKHRRRATWRKGVDRFIALTEFSRQKFISAGLPPEKIVVKPNFGAHPVAAPETEGDYALFIGRLSEEKGIETLLAAWRQLGGEIPLRIAGDGPLRELVTAAAAADRSIRSLGQVSARAVEDLLRNAAFLVMPSIWYEGFPVVFVEAFRMGLPVVTSALGSMASIVADGQSGLLVPPSDAGELAAAVRHLYYDRARRMQFRQEAHATYLRLYTPERNYAQLMAVYEGLLQTGAR